MGITRADRWLLVLSLVIVGAGILLVQVLSPGGDGEQVVVQVDGEEIYRWSWDELEQGQRIPIEGPLSDSVLEVNRDPDRVRMLSSPCPDQICVHQEWIEQPGQSIVCLPNRVVIRIEAAADAPATERLDGLTY